MESEEVGGVGETGVGCWGAGEGRGREGGGMGVVEGGLMGSGGGGKLSSTSPEGLGFVRSFNSCSQCVWEEIFIKLVRVVRVR